MNINYKLKAAIIEKGYTVRDLSVRTGIEYNTLNRKIKGQSGFYEKEMQVIAVALNKKVTDIFFQGLLPYEQQQQH